jgi:hypothetical protein
VKSIEDALWNLTATEHIEDYTTSTGSSVPAQKTSTIERFPAVLVLHLKRFVYDSEAGGTQKLNKYIAYGSNLRMTHGECLDGYCARFFFSPAKLNLSPCASLVERSSELKAFSCAQGESISLQAVCWYATDSFFSFHVLLSIVCY